MSSKDSMLNSVLAMCHTCVKHKLAIIAQIIYALEKTIYG